MSAGIVGIVLAFILGVVAAEERCNCNYISHPQTDFCKSTYALHGLILDATPVPAPGDPDIGELYNRYIQYNISILEVFKGHGVYIDGEYMSMYTPRRGLCGETGLFHDNIEIVGSNQYLITGDTSVSESGEAFLVITNCNWIESWENVTPEQIQGLREDYSECLCKIYPTGGPLGRVGTADTGGTDLKGCIYNPIGALALSATDCETDHGVCRARGEDCQWELTPGYQECFDTRKEQLSNAAAAITSRKGCAIYSGKQRKKCLLKLLKSKISQL